MKKVGLFVTHCDILDLTSIFQAFWEQDELSYRRAQFVDLGGILLKIAIGHLCIWSAWCIANSMDFEWKSSIETLLRCISTFRGLKNHNGTWVEYYGPTSSTCSAGWCDHRSSSNMLASDPSSRLFLVRPQILALCLYQTLRWTALHFYRRLLSSSVSFLVLSFPRCPPPWKGSTPEGWSGGSQFCSWKRRTTSFLPKPPQDLESYWWGRGGCTCSATIFATSTHL